MIATRLTERFKLQHPIVCAPMALVTGGRLAAAVTAAGGLGILGGGYAGTHGGEPDLDEEYRAAGNTPIGIGFISWAVHHAPHMIDWALAKKPACLFLSFGELQPFARQAQEAGVPLFAQAQTLADVRAAVDAGAAVVIAQGAEAGGHGGARSTLPFVPEAADWLAKRAPDVLLLAAGGIGDGRGLAAVLTLGADGVLVGSRFWAAEEALTHADAVARGIAADGDATIRTAALDPLRGVDWPAEFSFRVLRNKFAGEWQGRDAEARAQFGALKEAYAQARRRGDYDMALTVVGEATGLIHAREPAARIVASMVTEAEAALRKGAAKVV
jgi:nitronate monooxygenase